MTALITGLADAWAARPAPRDAGAGPGRRRAGAWRFAVLTCSACTSCPDRRGGAVHRADRGRGGVTLEHYTEIPGAEGFAEAFSRSLALAGLTVVIALLLMVPTVVLVELRLRRLRTTVELLTLMPLVLPPIALVVGVRSVLSWAPDYFLNTPLAEAFFALQKPSLPWILVFVYVILALPFVYRALDAGVRGADLRTLTEAARNLGASWPGCCGRSSSRCCGPRCSTPRSSPSPSSWGSSRSPSSSASRPSRRGSCASRVQPSCRWRSRCSRS